MDDADHERAFNEGADARLAGLPLWHNPHRTALLAFSWRAGWRDVNDHWSRWVRGRWHVRNLPKVKEIARNGRPHGGLANGFSCTDRPGIVASAGSVRDLLP